MSESSGMIRVGPAGWNYKDWYGNVYPEPKSKGFKELDFIANFFDTAEINSTFYRPPNSFMGSAWVRKLGHNPNFKFTAKLWQRFTHDRKEFTNEEVKLVTDGIDPLAQSDKLGALLCQFPWSFRNNDENKKWLITIFDTFHNYPLVVELRHASWDKEEIYTFLDNRDVGFATIDQPVIGQSIAFKPVRTGPIGYVRMHGRNYKDWFPKKNKTENQEKNKMSRYDYYYSADEIKEITEKVKQVAEGSKETYVVQNNHPRGQAVANATQIRAGLGEAILRLPETMFTAFPELSAIAQPFEDNTGQTDLLDSPG
ncbi:MAG: DUF72 domain-containing protein [Syntrophaceae bacterium]|nr:DUF72 domain-containing protein [Syntrophaceae bacterium]